MKKTSHRFYWGVQLALFSLFVPAGLFAQSTIDVTCVDASGSAVRGAKVFLQNLQNPKTEDKKTNRQGSVTFKKLDDGVYRVWARADGMAPALRDLLWLRQSVNSQEQVQLTLEPGNPEQGLYFEDQTVLNQANQLTQDAVDLFGQNDFEGAEAKLRDALKLYPSSPVAHQNLGLALLRQEKWEDGKSELQAAADYMEIFGLLGDTRMAQARQQVLAAIQTIPLQRLAVEANALMSDKKYDEALVKFQDMQKLAPDNPDVYYNMALAQAHANMIPGAKQSINKALQLRPTDSAYTKLQDQILQIEKTGESLRAKEILDGLQKLYDQGEYQAVIDQAKDAQADLPEESQRYLWLLKGRAQLQTKQYADAVVSYRKAADQDAEKKAETLNELATNLLNAEQYDQAFEVYADYFKAASKPADEGFYALGNQLSNKGKADEAGALFKRVLEINPDHPGAHYSLGMHYFYDKNDRENAKKLLERYIEIGKDEAKLNNAKSVLIVMEKTP